jgi:hypothetical protein
MWSDRVGPASAQCLPGVFQGRCRAAPRTKNGGHLQNAGASLRAPAAQANTIRRHPEAVLWTRRLGRSGAADAARSWAKPGNELFELTFRWASPQIFPMRQSRGCPPAWPSPRRAGDPSPASMPPNDRSVHSVTTSAATPPPRLLGSYWLQEHQVPDQGGVHARAQRRLLERQGIRMVRRDVTPRGRSGSL